MTSNCPILSIIVAAPPDQEILPSIESLRVLDVPEDFVEMIITRGRMPSIQRNVAVKHASGQWLYFLDDDSILTPQSWERVMDWLGKSDAEVVGGPNLCPEDASFVQTIFEVLLGSALTFVSTSLILSIDADTSSDGFMSLLFKRSTTFVALSW